MYAYIYISMNNWILLRFWQNKWGRKQNHPFPGKHKNIVVCGNFALELRTKSSCIFGLKFSSHTKTWLYTSVWLHNNIIEFSFFETKNRTAKSFCFRVNDMIKTLPKTNVLWWGERKSLISLEIRATKAAVGRMTSIHITQVCLLHKTYHPAHCADTSQRRRNLKILHWCVLNWSRYLISKSL